MTERNFMKMLRTRQKQGFHVCVGLDSDSNHKKFPESAKSEDTFAMLFDFNKKIVDATADIAACYKINTAFYEQHGDIGWEVLRATIAYINGEYSDIPVIVDGKRGDIDNTNSGYVKAIFGLWNADATTVPPYMGGMSLTNFFENPYKGAFVLTKTSNEGAGEFQDLEIVACPATADHSGLKLHEVVAIHFTTTWDANDNIGLVAGATNEGLERIRQLVGPNVQILIPGVGAQGGSLEGAAKAASQDNSRAFIINASRSVIFASSGEDFPQAARAEVQRMNDVIAHTLNPN